MWEGLHQNISVIQLSLSLQFHTHEHVLMVCYKLTFPVLLLFINLQFVTLHEHILLVQGSSPSVLLTVLLSCWGAAVKRKVVFGVSGY